MVPLLLHGEGGHARDLQAGGLVSATGPERGGGRAGLCNGMGASASAGGARLLVNPPPRPHTHARTHARAHPTSPRHSHTHARTHACTHARTHPPTLPTSLAGEPATMVRASTGLSTSEPAPIMEPSPIVMLPRTWGGGKGGWAIVLLSMTGCAGLAQPRGP